MKKLIFLLFIAFNLNAFSQQYSNDLSFNIGTGFDNYVMKSELQSDGKIVLCGSFSSFNGISRNRIIRLNADGSNDPTFNPGLGFNNQVNDIAIQSDGKILAVGSFTTFNGTIANRIARLNSNGTIDATFNSGTGFNTSADVVNIQSDGKIIVGGVFLTYNGVSKNRIIRLSSTGAIDPTFNMGTGFNSNPRTIEIGSNGHILIGGAFTTYNGITANQIVRLNVDGSIDATFSSGSGTGNVSPGIFRSTRIQPDGKILVGGFFTSYNGNITNCIIRLNSDGTLDPTFITGTGFNTSNAVSDLEIQIDGKVLVVGFFSSYNGNTANKIVRLNNNGTIDDTFYSGFGFDNYVNGINIQPDGKIISYGNFTSYNNIVKNRLTRLFSCGNIVIQSQNIDTIVCDTYISQTNQTYTQSGSYNEVIPNIYGCDSIHRLINLTVLNSTPINSSFQVEICSGETYNWNNVQYSSEGQYQQIFSNQCRDSTVTLNLIVNPINNSIINATTCQGDPYVWNNQQYLNAGQYLQTFSNQFGCDSIVTLNLSILNNSLPTIVNVVHCELLIEVNGDLIADGYLWPVNGELYYSNGEYDAILIDQFGCDSTVTLDLTIYPNWRDTSVVLCNGEEFQFEGNNYSFNQSGNYWVPINSPSVLGCDSILFINPTILPQITSSINISSCQSFTSNLGQVYTESGSYQEIIQSVSGCDSVINLNLNISSSNYLSSNDSIQPSFCSSPTGSIEINLIGSSPIIGQGVYISEYFSGVDINKSIELYNPTNQAIDIGEPIIISGWGIEANPHLINSSGQSFNLPIGTIIQPHETLIISNNQSQIASSFYSSIIDGTTITLAYIGYAVVFPGTPPVAITSVYDVAESIQNRTLIRKKTVVLNNSVYDSTEWDLMIFPSNIIESYTLGIHHSINPNNYLVEWSTGATGNTLSPILPGAYDLNIIDLQNNCIVQTESLVVPITGNNFNPTFSSANQLYTAPPFAVQFTNSTANPSNYTFTWDFGDGTTLASNNASVFHQYLFNGQYTVSLIATDNVTGCSDTTTLSDYIFCTGGVSCTHTAAINQTSPQQACQGTPLWLTCNNDPSFTYQWRRNGVTIPGNNNDSLQVSQSGTYSVIISANNCPITSGDVVVTIFSAPSTPIITSSGEIQPCMGGSVSLNAGNYTTYNWSTGATTQSINVTSSGTYTVSVTGANSCSATSAPFNVNASFVAPPQVCIVGMDSLTNENRIVWEKPLTLGIDSFYVYKESNVSNVYTKIGATDYNQLAVFLDANSNPAVQAYRYKISALDTCGTESNVGDFHKTMHLTINQGVGNSWNLIWSHYEGLNFGSYNIYRGTSLSNMALLTTIQSNLNSYTDLTPPTGPLFYQIEVVNPNNCDPTKIMNYGLSKSNIVDNGVIGISEEVLSTINVYPNPTNDKFTLNVSNDLIGKGYLITDFSGRIISQGKINSLIQIIDIQEISKGSYFLQIDKSTAKAIKIIKQ